LNPLDSIPKKRYTLIPVPILFYTPETRLGFGASVLSTFNFKSDSIGAPRSNVSLGFAYTQNKQILSSLPFNLFIKNRIWQVYGEITYNRFFYNFYGVGNDQAPDFSVRYGVEFPRLRLTTLRKVAPHFYAGLRYAFDKFSLFDLDTTAQLVRGTIPGSNGGTVSGFGLVTIFDNRDNIYYPSKGMWGELVVYNSNTIFGSSFDYTRVAFDFSKYFHYKENILALNLYSIYSNTDVPFFQMGLLGGQKKMRGFYEGRYRDNNVLVFQAEYRRHLFWLLGFTVFGDMGQVAHRYDSFNTNDWRYTYGLGLRLMLDQTQKTNLRVDFAIGDGKMLPYFTIFEAF
jgi:outer membrane protein assembly factor BamA